MSSVNVMDAGKKAVCLFPIYLRTIRLLKKDNCRL